ncbi:MAG: Rossmann-like and DUF2520 domain-containing protein [Bacteroidota bacterium]
MDVFASVFRSARPSAAIIGAGAAGRALALRLSEMGYPVRAIISRTKSRADVLARAVGAEVSSAHLEDIPGDTSLVLICVPDDQLSDVAELLTGVRLDWPNTVVAHVSGAALSSVLEPLNAEGAAVLSFHPLQTLTRRSGADSLDGAYVGLEGPPRGVAAGIELAVGLGLRYVVIPPEAKPRYHLAAAMTSNFVVTLLGMVQEVLASLDIDRRDGLAMLEPLLRGTMDNLARRGPEEALTGPVVRGDLDTIRSHGLALRQNLPQLVPAYAALSVETVRLAVRSGRLDPARAEDLLTLLQRMVTTPMPPRGADRPPVPPSVEAG